MTNRINLQGQHFGRLVVLRPAGRAKNGVALWACRCMCGNVTTVRSKNLRAGGTKSCGCLLQDFYKYGGGWARYKTSQPILEDYEELPDYLGLIMDEDVDIPDHTFWGRFFKPIPRLAPNP